MDETKIALPAWLPWATTACLAALVACLGELWIIEKTRTQMVRDEILLSETSLKAAQNQLEAERIVSRREIEQLRAAPPVYGVALLSAPKNRDPLVLGHPWGVATWSATGEEARIRLSGLASLDDGRDYQLWIEDSAGGDLTHCLIRSALKEGEAELSLHFESPVPPGYRILLIEAKKGGASSLDAAMAEGSIVLATPAQPGKISN
jgi:hypothetical protein